MGFKDILYYSPSTKGDLSAAHLDLSLALDAIMTALRKVQADRDSDLSKEFTEMQRLSARSFERFKALSGWEPDE